MPRYPNVLPLQFSLPIKQICFKCDYLTESKIFIFSGILFLLQEHCNPKRVVKSRWYASSISHCLFKKSGSWSWLFINKSIAGYFKFPVHRRIMETVKHLRRTFFAKITGLSCLLFSQKSLSLMLGGVLNTSLLYL